MVVGTLTHARGGGLGRMLRAHTHRRLSCSAAATFLALRVAASAYMLWSDALGALFALYSCVWTGTRRSISLLSGLVYAVCGST